MIKYEQITPRQAVELFLQGESDKVYVETTRGLQMANGYVVSLDDLGNINWFIRIEQNESK